MTISPIKLRAASLEPGGLRTSARGGVTSPLDDPTLSRLIASGLHGPTRVLLSKIGRPLEHLGRPAKDLEHALRVNRRAHQHACGSRLQAFPRQDLLVEPGLELVSGALALISDSFALVGRALTLVGRPIPLVSVTVSPIELPAPLLQPGGLRTDSLSRLPSPLGDSTLGVGSSERHTPPSVHLGQISCPLEFLGRPREDCEQALRFDR